MKVTCKHCGKVWKNTDEYRNRQPCDEPICPILPATPPVNLHNMPRLTSPKHSDTPEKPRQMRLHVTTKLDEVKSVVSSESKLNYFVKAPKAIVIKIQPRGFA